MTGSEHYQEAERLVDLADHAETRAARLGGLRGRRAQRQASHLRDEALVHAVLALAAATAEMVGRGSDRDQSWREVFGG